MTRRVFVSGGAGVIGREVVPRLVERGATVFVGDLKPRPADFPPEVRYRQGDLNTLKLGELEAFAPDVFIHLAATYERSAETYDFWEANFWHNTRLSHHLMTLARELPSLRRVIFASSYLIYDPALYQFDEPQDTPVALHEELPVLPRNLTGMAKLAHELELRFLQGFDACGFSTVSARIYRGYGCGSRDVISRWVRALLAGETIQVYRPEGAFDYVYSKDSAEGLVRLVDAEQVTGVINLGTGRARRVAEVVEVLRRHFPGMGVEEGDADIPYEASQADMTRFAAAVGWTPEYDLESAIPEIVAYERARGASSAASEASAAAVLVTSASRKIALIQAVKEASARIHPDTRVVAGDLDENALARHVADDFWAMPPTVESALDAIIAGCRERGISTVIPTRDGELQFWSENVPRFSEAGIEVVVAPPPAIALCLDKLAFAHFGEENGLPFIPAALRPEEVGPGPYVVKERFGAGARKIGLGLSRDEALEHARALDHPIYQPFVTGREISVDAWLDRRHQVKGVVLRTRDRVVDGESQVTTTFRDPETEATVRTVLAAVGLRGPVVLQGILDAEGRLRVIECNTRLGGATTASIAAGLDLVYWSLLESYGMHVDDHPFDRVEGEVRQVRVPMDLHLHAPGF